MNISNPERRQLAFENLDEVAADARHLLNEGYVAVGNWNLVQVCGHCAAWLEYPLQGYPKSSFPLNFVLWLMKKTVGRSMIRKMLREKAMPAGNPTAPQSVVTADSSSESDAVARLERALKAFQNHSADFLASPLFGRLSREEAFELQLIHCAHHFSFLVPANQVPGESTFDV